MTRDFQVDGVWLDNAAAPPIPSSLLEAHFKDLSTNMYGNPHSLAAPSKLTRTKIDQIRKRILNHFNATDYDVIFTLNASHALHLVATSFCWKPHSKLWYHTSSHTSVLGLRTKAPEYKVLDDDQMTDNLFEAGQDSLLVYPAQCNFSGKRYSMNWAHEYQSRGWTVLVDVASLVSTEPLNLENGPDMAVLSFYKMFGFPTGLGALLIKKSCHLDPGYFGGGTVLSIDANDFQVLKKGHDRFEFGTLPFTEILALEHGFNWVQSSFGSFDGLSKFVSSLATKARKEMRSLVHSNGQPVIKIYGDETTDDFGPIIAFNILRPDGSFVGYSEVMKASKLNKIHLRTGCMCNPGACAEALELSSDEIIQNYQVHGHVCGDDKDLIHGKPTGAVRISFGFCNTQQDVTTFINFIKSWFLCEGGDLKTFNTDEAPVISKLFVYPIKSCRGYKVEKWPLNEKGLFLDRHFSLLNANGKTLTQLKNPKMAQIFIKEIDLIKNEMIVCAPNMSNLTVSFAKHQGWSKLVQICTRTIQGTQTIYNDWFSQVLGEPVSFIQDDATDPLSFQNEGQILLASETSFEQVAAQVEQPISINSFRPNIIIKGAGAFQEEGWIGSDLVLHSHSLHVVSSCVRCGMINIDQEQGKRGAEPLKTLSRYHRVNGQVVFGIYLSIKKLGQEDLSVENVISISNPTP